METILNDVNFRNMQENMDEKTIIILKFTATWCGPCKKIDPLCKQIVEKLPASIRFYEIDIDESIELYMKLKTYKMVNGIPALLAYKDGSRYKWYIPDFSVVGSKESDIINFFETCVKYVQ